MSRRQLTWKYLIYMMVSGLPACGLVLLIIQAQTGRIGSTAIVATIIGYVVCCALLIVFARSGRSKQTRIAPSGKDST